MFWLASNRLGTQMREQRKKFKDFLLPNSFSRWLVCWGFGADAAIAKLRAVPREVPCESKKKRNKFSGTLTSVFYLLANHSSSRAKARGWIKLSLCLRNQSEHWESNIRIFALWSDIIGERISVSVYFFFEDNDVGVFLSASHDQSIRLSEVFV